MAEENQNISHGYKSTTDENEAPTEISDRGLFDFLGKKKEEEKPAVSEEAEIATQLEHVHVSECEHLPEKHKLEEVQEVKDVEKEEKKHSLLEKLHRSDSSSSSSSSEEEVEEGGEKIRRKKKKGLKEKIKEKVSGDKVKEEEEEEEKKVNYFHEDTSVPIEVVTQEETLPVEPEEKKGFLEKIKEKLPGAHKKPEDQATPVVAHPVEYNTPHDASPDAHQDGEPKEKKGIFEKIKEKLPGYHKSEDDKEKDEKKAETHY